MRASAGRSPRTDSMSSLWRVDSTTANFAAESEAIHWIWLGEEVS